MGSGVDLRLEHLALFTLIALLVAFFSAAGGLTLGCSVSAASIGLMFTLVVAPLIFFGCVYYPWSALETLPILQKVVLINPLVYASEGFRGSLVPQFPHLSMPAILGALVVFNALIFWLGLNRFRAKAVG